MWRDIIAILTVVGAAAGVYGIILVITGEKWRFKK